mmetsp:Transcript_74943/g.219548  ORF Transcript_74943/g.219548 Transcript_74943/m.219548 type:complete len:567 (-) Transcript_74943:10-1710(-)
MFLSPQAFVEQQNAVKQLGAFPLVVDLRSQQDFDSGHVPGAVNVPFLEGANAAEAGALKKLLGTGEPLDERTLGHLHARFKAMLLQVRHHARSHNERTKGDRDPWASAENHPAEDPVDLPSEDSDDQPGDLSGVACGEVILYCFTGSLRSRTAHMFLAEHNWQVVPVAGGYKAFVAWVHEVMKQPRRVCVIAGATGSGKTEVLSELASLGAQVLDLEGAACHKGSVFGHLGERPQPTRDQFRNLLAVKWAGFDPDRFVFIEDEGPHIGAVGIPSILYRRMRGAQVVLQLDVSFELRTKRLISVYGPYGAAALSEAVRHFETHMGHERTQTLLGHLDRGELQPVCEAALLNYDVAYKYHLRKQRADHQFLTLQVNSLDSAAVASEVIDLATPLQGTVPLESQVSAEDCEEARPPLEAEWSMEAKDSAAQRARCFCGAVSITAHGDPASVSICHCSVCRRLSGAPFVVSALFKCASVVVSGKDGGEAKLTAMQTSPQVTRQRCAECSSPVAAVLGERFRAVPLALFDSPPAAPAWRPQHHLHYDSRVMDVEDRLLKYRNRARGPVFME